MRILFNFPTRRRHVCFRTLDRYYEMAADLDRCVFHLSCDDDDAEMLSARGLVAHYKNCCISFTPNPRRAANPPASVLPHRDWDIIAIIADDYIPRTPGYDAIIRREMERHYPDLDGVLHFNDGHQGPHLMTHPVMGRKYFDRFGYAVNPAYAMLYADNEATEVARRLGRITFFPQILCEHQHPAWGYGERDALYTSKDGYFAEDGALFEARKARNFDLA